MARGDFLQGLSEGIFERQRDLTRQQEDRDFQQKSDIVRMLTGLADRVEPDSLPLLMGHIWDTIGVKKSASGKGLRGFLDAFSGMPNRSVEDQLGTKLREITSGMVGPQAARDTRLKNNLAQKGIPGLMQAAPNSAYGQQAASDAQGLKNKMVFRDPYQQRIAEIEARAASNLENQLSLQNLRNEAAINKQRNEYELRDQLNRNNNERKLTFARDQLVKRYINDPEFADLPVDQKLKAARAKADQELIDERELKLDNIQSQMDLRTKIGNKADREAVGGTPSQKLAEKKFDYTKSEDRRKIEEQISAAQATFDTLGPQVESKLKSVDDWAKQTKRTREQLLGSKFSVIGPIGKSVKEYNEAKQALDKAKGELDAKKKSLEDFDKQQGGGQPSRLEAVPPAKPQRKGGGIRVREEQGVSQGYMPGDIREISGKKYVVRELKNGFWILDPR